MAKVTGADLASFLMPLLEFLSVNADLEVIALVGDGAPVQQKLYTVCTLTASVPYQCSTDDLVQEIGDESVPGEPHIKYKLSNPWTGQTIWLLFDGVHAFKASPSSCCGSELGLKVETLN